MKRHKVKLPKWYKAYRKTLPNISFAGAGRSYNLKRNVDKLIRSRHFNKAFIQRYVQLHLKSFKTYSIFKKAKLIKQRPFERITAKQILQRYKVDKDYLKATYFDDVERWSEGKMPISAVYNLTHQALDQINTINNQSLKDEFLRIRDIMLTNDFSEQQFIDVKNRIYETIDVHKSTHAADLVDELKDQNFKYDDQRQDLIKQYINYGKHIDITKKIDSSKIVFQDFGELSEEDEDYEETTSKGPSRRELEEIEKESSVLPPDSELFSDDDDYNNNDNYDGYV